METNLPDRNSYSPEKTQTFWLTSAIIFIVLTCFIVVILFLTDPVLFHHYGFYQKDLFLLKKDSPIKNFATDEMKTISQQHNDLLSVNLYSKKNNSIVLFEFSNKPHYIIEKNHPQEIWNFIFYNASLSSLIPQPQFNPQFIKSIKTQTKNNNLHIKIQLTPHSRLATLNLINKTLQLHLTNK